MRGDVFVADYVQGWVKRLDVDAPGPRHRLRTTSPRAGPASRSSRRPTGTSATSTWAGATRGRRRGAHLPVRRATQCAADRRGYGDPVERAPPLTVTLQQAPGRAIPKAQALTYDWDFGDGSARSTTPNPQHVYSSANTYTATLTVRDPQGAAGTATTTVVGRQQHPAGPVDRRTDGGLPLQRRDAGRAARLGHRRPGRRTSGHRACRGRCCCGTAATSTRSARPTGATAQLHAGGRPRRGLALRDPVDGDGQQRGVEHGGADDPAADRAADAGFLARRVFRCPTRAWRRRRRRPGPRRSASGRRWRRRSPTWRAG